MITLISLRALKEMGGLGMDCIEYIFRLFILQPYTNALYARILRSLKIVLHDLEGGICKIAEMGQVFFVRMNIHKKSNSSAATIFIGKRGLKIPGVKL